MRVAVSYCVIDLVVCVCAYSLSESEHASGECVSVACGGVALRNLS